MKGKHYLLLIIFVTLCVLGFSKPVYAYDGPDGWDTEYMTKDADGNLIYKTDLYTLDGSYTDEVDFRLYVQNAWINGVTKATFTSSNPKVAKVEQSELTVYVNMIYCVPRVEILSCGSSTITAYLGDEKYEFTIVVVPYTCTKIHSVTAYDYKSVKLSWQKVDCASGYVIARMKKNGSKFEIQKQINSKDTLSAVISAPYNVEYGYVVIPKIKAGNKEYYKVGPVGSTDYWKKTVYYKLTYKGAKITKLTPGSSKVTVNWATNKSIKQYKIYRKKNLNAAWKLVYTEKKATVGKRTLKQDAGTTYIYKVEYVFPEYTVTTSERSCYVIKKATTKKKAISIKLDQDPQGGQYGQISWANRDHTFYYQKGGKLHVVSLKEPNQKDYKLDTIYDYTLDSSGKVKSKKTIKLGKFDTWGGFYYGTDGCYYVAIGYYNDKESKSKTVIKVFKYSSSWKRQKTCVIKGGADGLGIRSPFNAGNCRMQMKGSKLYIETSRTMFAMDGINHQSNIGFAVDTNTMKYKVADEDYTSHSFNQFVQFDANNLYISNHGDAHLRDVNLTVVRNYGTKNQEIKEVVPFKIKGETGYNYTGLKEGGMETTADNVLIAGTSVPQNYKVAGVTGNKQSYAQNVFLIVTNKTTLKSQIKWLTTYNPKTTKVTVNEVRLVKLSDDYVALMYTTTKKSKDTLHYVVLNNDGKVVYSKTYSNMEFTASSQPILYNGAINWVDVKYTYKKENWYGMMIWEAHGKNYFYRIPAVTKK